MKCQKKGGAFWFNKDSFYEKRNDYLKTIELIKENTVNLPEHKRDLFIKHYYTKYTSPKLPPSWMVFESLTLGSISRIFSSLKRANRKIIAASIGMDETYLSSYLRSISYTRNLCAHHSRLWNRKFTIKPKIDKKKNTDKHFMANDRFYAQFIAIDQILQGISYNSSWKNSVLQLFKEFPLVKPESIGFWAAN